MRPAAEIEPVALGVELQVLPRRDRVDQLELEGFTLLGEQLLRLIPGDDLASEGAVARDDLAHLRFDDRQLVGREGLIPSEIVIEAVLDHWADGHLRARIELLHGFGHDMRRIVADKLERRRVLARENADRGIGLDRLGEVAELAVERNRHRLLAQRLGDGLGHLASRDSRFEVAFGTVGKCKGNHLLLLSLLRTGAGKGLILRAGLLAGFHPDVIPGDG